MVNRRIFVHDIAVFHCSSPVKDVVDSCRTGAASNVIFGLALGCKSCIIPIFVSFSFAAMYGIVVGMLSTIATGLAIDVYGPISDNAGGIAEMAEMSHRIRERNEAAETPLLLLERIMKYYAVSLRTKKCILKLCFNKIIKKLRGNC